MTSNSDGTGEPLTDQQAKRPVDPKALNAPQSESRSTCSIGELFEWAPTSAVMERLFYGDPLDLQPAVRDSIQERALLVDPQRLFNIVLARAAFYGLLYGFDEHGDIPAWVDARIDEACKQLMEEDWAEESHGLPVDATDSRYQSLLVGTNLDPTKVRKLALRFNRSPENVRKPLFQVLANRRPMREVAPEFGMEFSELRAMLLDRLGEFAAGPRALDDLDEEWFRAPGEPLGSNASGEPSQHASQDGLNSPSSEQDPS
jgi:hypothetical protein